MNPNEPNFGQLPPTPTPQQPIVPQQNAAGQYEVVPPLYPSAAVVPNNGHNPYEFIIAPPVKSTRLGFGGLQNSATKRLLVVAGVAILIIILGIIITSFLPKSSSTQSLTAIAQEQQELMRVAAQGETQAASETTRGLAYTIDLSIGTDQTQVLAYLTKHNTKLSVKQLSLTQDKSTDATLTAAQASSTFDSAFEKVMASQLQTYLSDLQKAYNSTSKTDVKQLLSTSYSAGKSLLNETQTMQAQSQ